MRSTPLVLVTIAGILGLADASAIAPLDARTSATPEQSASDLKFDAVSIKLRTDKPTGFSTRNLPNGTVLMVAGRVSSLLSGAYGATVDSKTLPPWAVSDQYDVTATSPLSGTATTAQKQSMLRAMLKERFNFSGHIESREQPAYDLIVARKDGRLGPNMKPSTADCVAQEAAQRASLEAALANGSLPSQPPLDPSAPPPDCRARSGRGVTEGDLTMQSLLTMLRLMGAGRPIVDKTGLTGYYRVRLEITLRQPGADIASTGASDPLDLFSALPAQLGLKLEDSRIEVNTLIVDRLERPTDN
jgi:uncharacterized protein (TIGR03435 family)